jgi:hypothetical protein
MRLYVSMLTNTDPEAVRLLKEAHWPWSNLEKAFIEARDREKETTEEYRRRFPARISYEELRDHGLAGPTSGTEQEAGLLWLRERLSVSK